MTKKKKRVKTKPVVKDAPKRAVGFVGRRWIIRDGGAWPINVSVIGSHAFEAIKNRRTGATVRARVVDVNSLYPTSAAALAALKPQPGFTTRYGKLQRIKIVVNPKNGSRDAYDLDGDNMHMYSRHIFTDKRAALRDLVKDAAKELTRCKKQHQNALRAYTRLNQQLKKA